MVYTNYMKNMRQRLHQTPELCHLEYLTQSILIDEIQKMGYRYHTVGTGIFCDLNVGAKKTIAFRADMDGLHIEEKTNLAFSSANKGNMHACGHDGHMALLLGFMMYLSENKPKVNVRFIFQPAEEGEGGAVNMIAAGVLKNVNEIYAIHVAPDIPKGKIGVCYGVNMAGTVEFDIQVLGKSCHAAERAKNGKDALACGIAIAHRMGVLAKEIEERESLLHVGVLEGGTGRNIVACSCKICATLRYFNDEQRANAICRMREIIENEDEHYKTSSTLSILSEYIPVCNDEQCVNKIVKICGVNTVSLQKKYAAEDFAYYVDKVAGAIMWLGVSSGENEALHSSTFNFDESCLEYGLETYIKLVRS